MTDYNDWRGFGLAAQAQMYELDASGTGDTSKPIDPGTWDQELQDYLPKSGGDYYVIRDVKGNPGNQFLKLVLAGVWDGDLPGMLAPLKFEMVSGNNDKMESNHPIRFSSIDWESVGNLELFRTIKAGETEPLYTFKMKLKKKNEKANTAIAAAYWCWR